MSVNVNGLHFVPATLLRRLFSRMNFSAILTLPQIRVVVEPVKYRRQIANNAFQIQFGAINEVIALGAVPLDAIHRAFRTRRFDHQSDAPCGTLWGMANETPRPEGAV